MGFGGELVVFSLEIERGWIYFGGVFEVYIIGVGDFFNEKNIKLKVKNGQSVFQGFERDLCQ